MSGGGAFNGIGVIYYNKKDFVTARHWFEKGMAANNPDCFYNMGVALARTQLGKKCHSRISDVRKSVQKRSLESVVDLARMHMNGQGTPQNCTELPVYFEFSTTSERDGQMN